MARPRDIDPGTEAHPGAAPDSGGWPLGRFRDARQLPLDERRKLHGDAFVAMLGRVLRRPERPRETASILAVPTIEPVESDAGALITEVWPIVRSGRNVFQHVSVGRTSNNDIVLHDTSVSKFHAYFKRAGDQYFLTDAGSRNGTRVNDVPVPAQGKGKPVALIGGVRLCFGSVEVVFLTAPQFWAVVDTMFDQ